MRIAYFIIGILLFAGCKPAEIEEKYNPEADLVWIDDHGEGRQVYLAFRKDFELGEDPAGEIHLYAHARYHLYVNGTFINFGPVRAYAESPEYDTYDISDYLKPGKNFITVKVVNDGMITYQVPVGPGAFICWGKLNSDNGETDLSTPGDWKVIQLKGYDPTSPKMTFATGAVENYDARKDPADVLDYNCDLSEWKDVTPLADQNVYDDFIPRTIPHLTQEERLPLSILGLYELKDDEVMYSFRVKAPDRTREEFGKNRIAFAQTYIYSPVKQTINAGLWWGDYFVNGKGPLTQYSEKPSKLYRRDYPVSLEKGWNHFFIRYGIVWASWDYYMTVPEDASLIFSPDKEMDDDIAFITAGPFPDDEEEKARDLDYPFEDRDVLKDFSINWVEKPKSETAGNPAFEVAWSYFDSLIDHGRELNRQGHEIVDHGKHVPEPLNLEGNKDYALIYDMGEKTLGRIFIDAESPEGTTFNVVFTEDTIGNRPWILKRFGLYTGARFTGAAGKDYFETFKPYGAKFLQVNVINATGPVKINKIGMVSQIYPYEKSGMFECSDPLMNRIWEMGWRTLEVCSEDTYTDTPYRERGLYAGDALPQYAIALVTSGDSRLMKRSIRVFADMYRDMMMPQAERRKASVNHMADYPLATLISYLWSVAMTKDIEFAEEFYEGYRNMLLNYMDRQLESGLYDHDRAFIEWTQIDKNANLTTIQSMIIYSLESFTWLADELGYSDDAAKFRKEASRAKEIMLEKCWDDEELAFHDGFREGEQIDHNYPISSAWPVIFGQTNEMQEKHIKDHFIKTLTEIGDEDRKRATTPYGAFYILEALYQLGMEDFAEFFMRKYWSPMIYKHNDTAWENFGDGSDGSGQGTLSHAWSGHPTYFMSTRVLGVRLGFPEIDFHDKIFIKPQSANITWAKGIVPHPMGLVEVDWRIAGDKLFLNYSAPEGAEVIVEPRGKLAEKELIVNEKPMTK